MQWTRWKADGLLFLAALIWGTAFVAQRVGMSHVGPLTFNGLRFALGCLVLVPLVGRNLGQSGRALSGPRAWAAGVGAGLILFAGASLQQWGLVDTTAGKAGFITGLYVVLVPLLGLGVGRRASGAGWLGAAMATAGLYLLSVTGDWQVERGDLLVLAGTVFWAAHILYLDRVAPRMNAFQLAALQSGTCAVISLGGALVLESFSVKALGSATIPILYGGVMSVGIAYTLQVVAQKHTPPTHTAILLSLETVFAALAGWLILEEHLGLRGAVGGLFMLGGMLVSQLVPGMRR